MVRHWAIALKALIDGDSAQASTEFDACRAELPRIGGSGAQRSIVEDTSRACALPVAG